jgi:hypothetical protein
VGELEGIMEDEREWVEGDMRCCISVRNLLTFILKLGVTFRPLNDEHAGRSGLGINHLSYGVVEKRGLPRLANYSKRVK